MNTKRGFTPTPKGNLACGENILVPDRYTIVGQRSSHRRFLVRGFTLIELLVVIAIIGLLSSIVYASLSSARAKGRVAAMQGNMRNAQTAAVLCMDDGTALNAPAAGTAVCAGSASTYAALPAAGTWTYPSAGQDLTTSDGTFSFAAAGDSKTITCKESGCVTQ